MMSELLKANLVAHFAYYRRSRLLLAFGLVFLFLTLVFSLPAFILSSHVQALPSGGLAGFSVSLRRPGLTHDQPGDPGVGPRGLVGLPYASCRRALLYLRRHLRRFGRVDRLSDVSGHRHAPCDCCGVCRDLQFGDILYRADLDPSGDRGRLEECRAPGVEERLLLLLYASAHEPRLCQGVGTDRGQLARESGRVALRFLQPRLCAGPLSAVLRFVALPPAKETANLTLNCEKSSANRCLRAASNPSSLRRGLAATARQFRFRPRPQPCGPLSREPTQASSVRGPGWVFPLPVPVRGTCEKNARRAACPYRCKAAPCQ